MKALWLSGGKDSVACLFLHEAELSQINVLWANTGKYLPEHLAFMDRLKAMCPKWHEVKSDREIQNEVRGIPADVVPVRSTEYGRQFSGSNTIKVQPYLQCCYENISGPLWLKTKALGCDTVIRGQRDDDEFKAPGTEYDGVTFVHPIAGWTARQVREYVASKIEIPDFYALEHTSVDCYDCTAYLAHSEDRAEYLRQRHPQKHRELVARLKMLQVAQSVDLKPMYRILEAANA